MTPYARQVQVEIARLANLKCDCHPLRLNGIAKYEGGVIVNHRHIAIHKHVVMDNLDRLNDQASAEETAVVAAISEIADALRADPNHLGKLPGKIDGHPLRSLLNLDRYGQSQGTEK